MVWKREQKASLQHQHEEEDRAISLFHDALILQRQAVLTNGLPPATTLSPLHEHARLTEPRILGRPYHRTTIPRPSVDSLRIQASLLRTEDLQYCTLLSTLWATVSVLKVCYP